MTFQPGAQLDPSQVQTGGDGTVTPGNFASVLLSRLGLPTSSAWQAIINQWVRAEGGFNAALAKQTNNPLNARCSPSGTPWGLQTTAGAIGCTASGFAKFPNLGAALNAYVNQLTVGGTFGGYNKIAHATSPTGLKQAIINSSWAAGHYGNGTHWPGGGGTGPVGIIGAPTSEPSSDKGIDWIGAIIGALSNVSNPIGGAVAGASGSDAESTITGAIGNIVMLLIGIAFILLGGYSLVKSSTGSSDTALAASIASIAATLRGRNAATPPAGMEVERAYRSPRGHVSYTFKPTRRGRETSGGYVNPFGVPVEEAITQRQQAPPSASSETPRSGLSARQRGTAQPTPKEYESFIDRLHRRAGAIERTAERHARTPANPYEGMSRAELRTAFLKELGAIK